VVHGGACRVGVNPCGAVDGTGGGTWSLPYITKRHAMSTPRAGDTTIMGPRVKPCTRPFPAIPRQSCVSARSFSRLQAHVHVHVLVTLCRSSTALESFWGEGMMCECATGAGFGRPWLAPAQEGAQTPHVPRGVPLQVTKSGVQPQRRCPNWSPIGAIERIFKCASFWVLDVRMTTSKRLGT
jgi:hypothetical protein